MIRCYGCMKEYEEDHEKCPYCGYDNSSKPKELYHIAPGSILVGRYLVGRSVGQGGFGITYIGWDLQLERAVAIKEYFPSDFATRAVGDQKLTIYNGEAGEQFGKGLESFIDEAQRLAKFNGIKGVVDIYDTFIENNTGYIVMEFLSGVSVKDMLKANSVIDYPTAKEIVVEMLYILREVHKEGIIHRDIAPDNIFITDSGEFKLLDFGAARYATTSHSKSLSVILKPGYAPEEQYRSHGNQGPWTDIYALAATFYKLITGVTPPESMERRTGDTLIPPSKMGVVMPKNDEIALLNALNVLPENRIQNAQELLDALGGKKVTRKKERNLRADTGRMYKFVVPLLATSAVILIGFVVCVKTGVIDTEYWNETFKAQMKLPDGYALVNNVVNMKQVNAETVLKKSGFTVELGEAFYSDTVPENQIAAQTPNSGAAEKGSAITLMVSKGPKSADVGLCKGRNAAEVKKELEEKGFYNVTVASGTQNTIAQGNIEKIEGDGIVTDKGDKKKSEIKDNDTVNLSAKIVLYESTGANIKIEDKKISVASYVGKPYETARDYLTKQGLQIGKVSFEHSSKYAEGIVISQNPANMSVDEGTAIDFFVSKGEKKSVSVPNVTLGKQSTAESDLKSAGFEVKVSYEYNSKVSKGLVILQNPSAGSKLTEGSTVSIVISRGAQSAVKEPATQATTKHTVSQQTTKKAVEQKTVKTTAYVPPVKVTEKAIERTTAKPAETTTKKPSKPFELKKTSTTVYVGGTEEILGNKSIEKCVSSDSSVASVTNGGKITGNAVGSAKITVYSTEGDTATLSVSVKTVEIVPSFKVNRSETKIEVGSSGSAGIEIVHPNSKAYEVRASGGSGCVEVNGTQIRGAYAGSASVTFNLVEKATGNVVDSATVKITVLPKEKDEDDDDEYYYDDDDEYYYDDEE